MLAAAAGQIAKKPADEVFTIRVLTLNCWGLWLGAKKRRQRMAGIVRYLRENNCDIVFLQEVWVGSDFDIIRNGTKDLYKFAHLFRSGSVLGSSGIVILSRWMPKVIHFEPYSLNGSPFYPWHGDWFAGKGIAYSRVDFDGLSLHLFSTHTHAYYKENEPVHDQYSVHRVCQSYQLARFITFISDTACNRKVDGKDLLIVAGDMNSTSSELPYKILTTMAGLTDCFKASKYNPPSNIFHKHKIINKRKTNNQGDYTRVSDSSNSSSSSITNTSNGGQQQSNNNNSSSRGMSFCRSKLGDNFLLDTLDDCRNKIAQVFFDSDTDDEDITYCHPRNSFTPVGVEYKALKSNNNNNNNSNNSNIPIQAAPVLMPPRKPVESSKKSPMKRIDFILCRLLTHGHCVVDRVATESKDPFLDCSLSDHEPVMVELKISDVSHDLMEKNHIISETKLQKTTTTSESKATKLPNKQNSNTDNNDTVDSGNHIENARPLASVVGESKAPASDQLEETTNQWVPEKVPVNLSFHECNIQVMESTQDILMQYYHHNRSSKTQLFYVSLIIFIVTLPIATYYALTNSLIPISTIVFMWLASSFLFMIGLLVGFLCYRFEQGAIEAILNDITCKISVSRNNL